MRLAYWGNFQPGLPPGVAAWSTETHVAEAFELAGHRVVRLQEGEVSAADVRSRLAAGERWDAFAWTQTLGLAESGGSNADRLETVAALREAGVPTVGMHLDRWWGLARERQVYDDAFFRLDLVCTADGGSAERWADAGVAHAWMPPGVHEPECVPGRRRPEMTCDVAFVGSWNGYHPESRHRRAMVLELHRRYGERFRVWPQGPAVRGRDLADLYASSKVVVGDSCLVGEPGFTGWYSSDRVPETIGRGGFLLHPWVQGVTDGTQYTDGEHLICWDAHDWDRLGALIDRYLEAPEERAAIAESGRRHVLRFHTYTVRVRQVLATLADRGLLGRGLLWPGEGEELVPEALPTVVQDGQPGGAAADAVGGLRAADVLS